MKASVPNKSAKAAFLTFRPAGKCTEGRQYQARRICGETAAAHRAAAMRDPRHRMQMTADFAGTAVRLVAKR